MSTTKTMKPWCILCLHRYHNVCSSLTWTFCIFLDKYQTICWNIWVSQCLTCLESAVFQLTQRCPSRRPPLRRRRWNCHHGAARRLLTWKAPPTGLPFCTRARSCRVPAHLDTSLRHVMGWLIRLLCRPVGPLCQGGHVVLLLLCILNYIGSVY